MIKVSVLDACPIYVHGLAAALRDKGFTVRDVTDSPLSSRWFTDVFLMDPTSVQDMTFHDFVANLSPTVPVTVLVDQTHGGSPDEFLRAGVAGVLDRCAPVEVVTAGLRAVASGRRFVGTATAVSIGHRPDPVPARRQTTQSHQWDEPDALSPRELQVLTQIARGMTHRQGARALGISQHTFDTYVKRIRTKLGVGNKAELTRAAVMRNVKQVS